MNHTLELVDESKNIYECTRCKARGTHRELINSPCKDDEPDGPQDQSPMKGGIMGGFLDEERWSTPITL